MLYPNAICPCCLSLRKNLHIRYKQLANKYDLIECENCGHGFILPTPTVPELNEFYTTNYSGRCKKNVNETLGADDFKKLYTAHIHDCKRRINFALKKANIKNKTLNNGLDLGCSYGTGVIALEQFTEKTIGIDIDLDAVTYGKQFLGDKLNIQTINTVESNSQDIITHYNVLEHVRDPINELHEIGRCLRADGGIYISKVPNYGSIWSKFSKENWYLMCPPEHLNFFTHKSMNIALKDAGLCPIFIGTTWGEATPSIITLGIRPKITSAIIAINEKLGTRSPRMASFLVSALRKLFKLLTITKRLVYRTLDLIIMGFRIQGNTITVIAVKRN